LHSASRPSLNAASKLVCVKSKTNTGKANEPNHVPLIAWIALWFLSIIGVSMLVTGALDLIRVTFDSVETKAVVTSVRKREGKRSEDFVSYQYEYTIDGRTHRGDVNNFYWFANPQPKLVVEQTVTARVLRNDSARSDLRGEHQTQSMVTTSLGHIFAGTLLSILAPIGVWERRRKT
jgi:hypothetical protein